MNTYKFYTKKGERLASFLDGDTITLYKCSLEDQFCRKAIRTAHNLRQTAITIKGNTETLHPEIIKFDAPLDSASFFKYLHSRFYLKRQQTKTVIVTEYYKTPKLFTL